MKKILGGISEKCPHCNGTMMYLQVKDIGKVSQCTCCGAMIQGKELTDTLMVISSIDGLESTEGKCKVKSNKMRKIKKYINLGRGKVFDYKYISSDNVILTKKGIDICMTKDDMLDCFEILGRSIY